MEENTKCVNLNNGNYCESKKAYVTVEECKNCTSKIEPFLNENLNIIID